jgi:hypothetical protein
MIVKGLWRYHATKPSQNRKPSRKRPGGADEACNGRLGAPVGPGIPFRNAAPGRVGRLALLAPGELAQPRARWRWPACGQLRDPQFARISASRPAACSALARGVAADVMTGGPHPVAAPVRAPLTGRMGAEEPADAAVGTARRGRGAACASEEAECVARQPGQGDVSRVGRAE